MASNLAIDSAREEENKACNWANAQTVASDRFTAAPCVKTKQNKTIKTAAFIGKIQKKKTSWWCVEKKNRSSEKTSSCQIQLTTKIKACNDIYINNKGIAITSSLGRILLASNMFIIVLISEI